MSLTTARLNEMAAPGGFINPDAGEDDELIEASRESVARQECEALLPKGWCITLNSHATVPVTFQAMAWNFYGGVSRGAEEGDWQITPVAAYVTLAQALAARKP
jgi:hypothetical protein